MSDKDTKDKKKKSAAKDAAKNDVAATEPTLDTPTDDAAKGVGAASEAATPQIGIQSQYVKDLSFENPGAPGSLVGDVARR